MSSQRVRSPHKPLPSTITTKVVRTCAAGGRLDRALELLEEMADARARTDDDDDEGGDAGGLVIEGATFSAVAGECLKQGLDGKAEEVLDWRDYL